MRPRESYGRTRTTPLSTPTETWATSATADSSSRRASRQAPIIWRSCHPRSQKNVSNTNTILSGIGGGAGATNPFDYDEDKGPADNDVRHALSLNGVTTLPLGVQVSGILTYRSALPYSVTTSVPLDADPFPDGPEARNSRRGEGYFSLDARVGKVIKLTRRGSVTGVVEVFNVTNATNLIRYVGVLGSSLFAQPTAALEKRRTQLGFRVEF